jgi:hypothetical protein
MIRPSMNANARASDGWKFLVHTKDIVEGPDAALRSGPILKGLTMFGNIRGSKNPTTWVTYNGKLGVFTIDHTAQNSEGSFREHKTTTGRTVYKEEYPDLVSAYVRRVMIREEDVYQKPGQKEHKICVSFRSPDGKDAVVKFSMGSSALQVLGAINAADSSQPLTLKSYRFEAGTMGKDKDGNDVERAKDEVRLVGYQGDQKLANKYGDAPDVQIPRAEKIEVTNPRTGVVIETVLDFTNQHEFILALAKSVDEKVKAASGHQPAPAAPSSVQPAPAAAADDGETPLAAADILGDDDGGIADEEAFANAPTGA